MLYGVVEVEMQYSLTVVLCGNVVSDQQTELEYACKASREELCSLMEDIRCVIHNFPEIQFDEYDSAFCLAADDQLPLSFLTPQKPAISTPPPLSHPRRECNNCCLIV